VRPLPSLGGSNHFASPLDLMDFGLNPILTAYPAAGQTWSSSRSSSEFKQYGVTGTTRVLGVQSISVPAGRFHALAVQSRLARRGTPFASGTRTCWFAPGKGLVKLVWHHGDGTTSTVVLLR
jgi:hypothetical protein